MKMLTSAINPLLACASLAFTFAASGLQADELHVSVASASSNKAYDLSFGPSPPLGAIALGITSLPALPSASVHSLVYVANEQTGKTDLVAADFNGSRIVRYAAAAGPAIPVWAAPTAGPRYPEGVAVDSFGNLYVNRGDFGHPQVWVLRRNPALPAGAGFLPPLLMDGTSFGTSITKRLLDIVVVGSATPGGLGAGDLLVLVNDGRVLRYSAASLKNFLAGAGPIAPPQTLVTAAQWPSGQTPTGMALWPSDGTLLVPTIGGAVLRYKLTPTGSTAMTAFATGLGLSLGKIKTFVRSNVPYAVFDQPLRNKIMEFGAPPAGGCPNLAVACNTPLATITTVSNPLGLAATDSSAPTQDCVFDNSNPDAGCTLLGGAVKLGVSSAAPGATIVDVSCTIDTDPRMTTGVCDGTPLAVSTLCPGYGLTVIPGYLCGGSGPSGRGFALIKSVEQNGFPTAPSDLLVKEELSADALLAPPNPICPQLTMAWAPLAGEGTIPELNNMIELTSYCGSSRGLPPGHSLLGVGLQLNPAVFAGATPADKLVTFANMKLDNLTATVNAANIPNSSVKTALASCVAKSKSYLNDTANLTAPMRYACAAHQAWTCDNSVNSANFAANPDQLSAYSAIRGRLANLILTINTRLSGNPASTVWPLADPGLPASSCDPDTQAPTPPANLAASYVHSNTGKNLLLQWTASTDPPPNASGVGGYKVYLSGVLVGSTTNTSFPITLSTNNSDQTFQYQVAAVDQATPTPNESERSSVTLSCYDPDRYTDPDPGEEPDCDAYP